MHRPILIDVNEHSRQSSSPQDQLEVDGRVHFSKWTRPRIERPTRHTHWPHPNIDSHMEWWRSSYVALYYRGPSARHTWRAIYFPSRAWPTAHLRWHGSTNTVHARSDIDERWLVAWTSMETFTCLPKRELATPHSCGFTRHALSSIHTNCNNRNMCYFWATK